MSTIRMALSAAPANNNLLSPMISNELISLQSEFIELVKCLKLKIAFASQSDGFSKSDQKYANKHPVISPQINNESVDSSA